MNREELKFIFRSVWIIISFGILLILITPFLVPISTFSEIVPKCQSQITLDKPCIFCGMTTAFYHISHGEISQALNSNRLSLFLYSLFLINEFVISIYAIYRSVKNSGKILAKYQI